MNLGARPMCSSLFWRLWFWSSCCRYFSFKNCSDWMILTGLTSIVWYCVPFSSENTVRPLPKPFGWRPLTFSYWPSWSSWPLKCQKPMSWAEETSTCCAGTVNTSVVRITRKWWKSCLHLLKHGEGIRLPPSELLRRGVGTAQKNSPECSIDHGSIAHLFETTHTLCKSQH